MNYEFSSNLGVSFFVLLVMKRALKGIVGEKDKGEMNCLCLADLLWFYFSTILI